MTILVHTDGPVGHLRFSNPARHNALTQTDWLAVPGAVADLLERKCRVIIVSGEGSSFCAGADISEFDIVRKNATTARRYEQANVDAFAALRTCPVPTIAAIDTYCLGGGFGLAAACDLRLATPRAQFSIPPAKLGLAYPVEAIGDIVRAVGEQNAKALLYTAERLAAPRLLEMGFLLEICPPEELFGKVEEMAHHIADLAPLTQKATKCAIAALDSGQWDEAKALADATFESADYSEGRKAFREKRPARFEGR